VRCGWRTGPDRRFSTPVRRSRVLEGTGLAGVAISLFATIGEQTE
jgi:hypothetical protein